MLFKGELVLPQSHWKPAFNSLLNFVNEEREVAYEVAINIYNKSKELDFESFNFEKMLSIYELTNYQKELIKNSLYKKNNNKVYKPKSYRRITNRSDSIDLVDFRITVDKVLNKISFVSVDFDNCELNELITDHPFINQYLTMVESIDWPTRVGPVKTVRGCSVTFIKDGKATEFYSAGNNPPKINFDNSIVAKQPSFLDSTPLNKVSFKNFPLDKETHKQSINYVDPELC